MHWLALLFHSDCGFPKWPVAVMIPQNLFMLALFGDFYYRAYVQKTKKREPAPVTSSDDQTNDKIDTIDDCRYRHTNGNTLSHDQAKNGYANGYSNGFVNVNPNGIAANGKANGNIDRKINEMS